MPNALIKKIHQQNGVKTSKLEHEYKQLEREAEKNHVTNKFAYATAVEMKINKYKPENKKK